MGKSNKQAKRNASIRTPDSHDATLRFLAKDDDRFGEIKESKTHKPKVQGPQRHRHQVSVIPTEANNYRAFESIDTQGDAYGEGHTAGVAYAASFKSVKRPIAFGGHNPSRTLGALDALFAAGVLVDQVSAQAQKAHDKAREKARSAETDS